MTQFSFSENQSEQETPQAILEENSQTQLSFLMAEVNRLTSRLSTLESGSTGHPPIRPAPKIRLPENFTGDRTKFRGFINQLNLVFSLRSAEYYSDIIKISTFGTLLEGKALRWFTPFVEKGLHLSMSWSDFLGVASGIFDDPNRTLTAESRLQNLAQTGSVSDYISEFNALSSEVIWAESTLISFFRRGLKSEILDLTVAYDVPNTMLAISNMALRIENRISETRELKRSKRSQQGLANPGGYNPGKFTPPSRSGIPTQRVPSANAPHKVDPDAMDLDSSRRGPISNDERQRRYRLGLCLYCGGTGHSAGACSKKPTGLNASTANVEELNQGKVNGQ